MARRGLLLIAALLGAFAPARAQETPPAAARPSSLDGLGQGDTPGGVDFGDPAAVLAELARVREAYAKLDAAAQPGLARQLQRQQDVLSRQRDFLPQHERLKQLKVEASAPELATAAAQRDAALAALATDDPDALLGQLRATTDAAAMASRLANEFEGPWNGARRLADTADAAFADAESEGKALPRLLDESRAAQTSVRAELEAIRARRLEPDLPDSERADLFEQSLAAEEELVHHRMRAAFLEEAQPWIERRVTLLAARQQQARAEEQLAASRLAVARRHAQSLLAEAKQRADDEVVAREAALAASQDERDRLWNEVALEVSRLAAQQRAAEGEAGTLADRLAAAQKALAAAKAQHDGYVARYRGEGTVVRDDPAQVALEIEALQAQTHYFDYQAERAELRTQLRAAVLAATETAERGREVARMLAERRDRARALVDDAAWAALEPRWTGLAEQLHVADAALAELGRSRIATLRRLLAAEEESWEARNAALAVVRSENLFLVEESEISRDSLLSGFDDLASLPKRTLELGGAARDWIGGAGHPRSLLLCLAGLLPLALLVVAPRWWLGRLIARLSTRDLASQPVRTALLLAHVGRRACTAAALWIAPQIATALLADLPEVAVELLHGLGRFAAVFWLLLAVARELFHADPAERMVFTVDRTTARRVGAALTFLLWFSLGYVAIDLVLQRVAYRNLGAIAALDLVHKTVVGAIAVFVLCQRQLLLSLLPGTERALGLLLRRVVAFLQPFLVLLVPATVVLDAVGYRILAAFITRVALLVVAAFPIGSIAYQAIVFALEAWRERRLADVAKQPESAEAESERIRALDEIARFLLRVAIVVLLLVAMLQFTGTSATSLRSFFDRPLPLQDDTAPALRRTWWNVLLAVVIVFLSIRVARHLKIALESLILPLTHLARATQYTITTLVVYVLHGFGFWLALTQVLQLQNLGYLVAALSVGIGFGLQEIISNFVSGLILLVERPIKPGDTITLGDGSVGTVRALGIRATTIQTGDNLHILVPNREFITQRVVNHDAIDPRVRATIDVGVAFGSDVKRVRDTLLEVAANDGRLLARPAPEVTFVRFGESALEFRLQVWLASSGMRGRIESDLRFAVDAAFARAKIAIPFPTRDLQLRSDAPLRVAVEPPAAKPPEPPPPGGL